MAKRLGRPVKSTKGRARVSLGLKVTAKTKNIIDSAASKSGRSQSQEAELLIERGLSFERMLERQFSFERELESAQRKFENTLSAFINNFQGIETRLSDHLVIRLDQVVFELLRKAKSAA